MIHTSTWSGLRRVLALSKNIRFTLEYSRWVDGHKWRAVLATEKGRVLGTAVAGEADQAVLEAVNSADLTQMGTAK